MKVGDKVVCVDFSVCDCGCPMPKVLPSVVYVINHIRPLLQDPSKTAIELIGVEPFYGICGLRHTGFWSARFRLLDELKQENRDKAKQGAAV